MMANDCPDCVGRAGPKMYDTGWEGTIHAKCKLSKLRGMNGVEASRMLRVSAGRVAACPKKMGLRCQV